MVIQDVDCVDDSQLDPVDVVRGLAHLDVLLDLAERREQERLATRARPPRTASEAHMAAHGHRLRFGCCR